MSSNKPIIGAFNAVDSFAITVHQERCAKVRNRNVSCLRCADACTSGCIALVDGELVINASKCVGCGTCATVCPTCALEARNPSDTELIRACHHAVHNGQLCITCQPMAEALDGVLDKEAVAQVVCLGRLDESLLVNLAASGIGRVCLLAGDCERCDQRIGVSTAQKVVDGTLELLSAWRCGMHIDFCSIDETPSILQQKSDLSQDELMHLVRKRVKRYFCNGCGNKPLAPHFDANAHEDSGSMGVLQHVMDDGTLPHFLPDRRDRLLNALATMGNPAVSIVASRLWGCVIIDSSKCSACRMCATFCPTGAICKFDDEDGSFGVEHYPGDCVKCRSCEDICPEGAIAILDRVPINYIMDGSVHRYRMKEHRVVDVDEEHQIKNMMDRLIPGNVFER